MNLRERYNALPQKAKYLVIFCGVIFACFVVMLIVSAICSIVKGEYFFVSSSVFFQDTADAFMDFFNVNFFMNGMDPYVGAGSSYPPTVLLFAKIFQLIQGVGETARDVRLTARGIIALIIYLAIFFVCAWLLLRAYLKRNCISRPLTAAVYIAFILSSPMLFALDRGNYLLYAFLFVGFFLLNYRNDKRWLRELSYLSLALAVSFKLYPAIFGFLLLNRKDWPNLIKTAIYSVILLLVPLFFFEGGFMANAKEFLGNLLNFSSQKDGYYSYIGGTSDVYVEGSTFYLNGFYNAVSLSGVVQIVASLISGISLENIPSWVGTAAGVIAILLALVCVVSVYFTKKDWIKVFLLTSVMTFVVSTNYEYSLIFFIFPVLMFIMSRGEAEPAEQSEREPGWLGITCLVLSILIFMPLPLGYIVPKYTHALQHGYPTLNLIQTIAYLAATVLLIVIAFRSFIKRRKGADNVAHRENSNELSEDVSAGQAADSPEPLKQTTR